MSDEYTRVMQQARALAESGNMEAAKRAAGIARKYRTQQEQPKPWTQTLWENVVGDDDPTTQNTGERVGAALNKAGEAMTFGLIGDEASAAAESVLPGVNYADRRDHYRQQEEVLERDSPALALGADVGGSLAGAMVPLGAAAQGVGLASRIGRSAALGAAGGATYGAAEGEGAQDRAQDALTGGMWGLGVGAAAPVAVGAGRAAYGTARDMIGGGIDNALGRASDSRARRAIAATLQKSGRSADDVSADVATARLEGQPEFRMMDAMGFAGQRRASGVARAGGEGSEELSGFLRQRQVDQSDRVGRFVDDAFETNQGTAKQVRAMLKGNRDEVADRMYDAARKDAGPVDVRGAVSAIDRRIGGMQGSNIAGDGIDAKLARFRDRLAADPAPAGEISRELSDFDRVLGVKQDVQDAIGAAVRAGRNNEARELGKLVRELDTALEQASPDYRFANDNFREGSRVIDAVDTGADMARKGRAADNVQTFRGLSPQQQRAARMGYGDAVQDSIERNKAQAPNSAREFASTKRQQEAAAIATDPDMLSRRIGRENTMYETHQRATKGSLTEDNKHDVADLGLASNFLRGLRDLAGGNIGNAGSNMVAAVQPILTGQSEGTRALIARMLMSDNPAEVLAPVIAQAQKSEGQRRLAEALMRRIAVAAPQ